MVYVPIVYDLGVQEAGLFRFKAADLRYDTSRAEDFAASYSANAYKPQPYGGRLTLF